MSLSHTASAQPTRPPQIRARRSNDPLLLPAGLVGSDARRWRDLMHDYSLRLGQRLQREDVRALLGSLVSLTLMMERAHDKVARDEPVDPNVIIQGTQTVLRLLAELDLDKSAHNDSDPPTLTNYLRTAP